MSRRILRGGEFARELLEEMPALDTVSWLEQLGTPLKADSFSRVIVAPFGGQTCYLKYYAPKSALQSVAFRLGFGRAVQAYDHASQLASAGITVPAAHACLLLDDGMLLVTEGLVAGQDLKALWVQGQTAEREQALLHAAGKSLAGLHEAGFAHGDCKWSNLFWYGEQFYLVDLEAVSRRGRRQQYRDVARFTVNAEDLGVPADQYQVFLKAYCSGIGIAPDVLIDRIRPELVQLRKRHRQKYGERGAPVI